MSERHAIHPVLGHVGAPRTVWLLYRPETGGIHKVFLTEPDPAALRGPAGYALGRFEVETRLLARIGSCRVRRGRVVMRSAAGFGSAAPGS